MNKTIDLNTHPWRDTFTVIAGPCSVEDRDTTLRLAEHVAKLGLRYFRAGAYKPRTRPSDFQGLAEQGLAILAEVKQQFGLAIVTEALDCVTLPLVAEVADIIQVGSRNMAHTSLLKALGQLCQPVLLKRGMAATLAEFLYAAEYITQGGNQHVILCERGIRTFCQHSRNTLDIAAIPYLDQHCDFPILVDPSHAAGYRAGVLPLARAGVAAGAHGLLIEMHDTPALALSDGQQALHPHDLQALLQQIEGIRACLA